MMLTVEKLFTLLSNGPLSNLAISDEGSGEIVETGKHRIIDHANTGLLRLHTRFLLREKEMILQMIEGITRYELLSIYGQKYKADNSDSTKPVFILDRLKPYTNDLIKVLSVFDIDGMRVPLNDQEDPMSVFTPMPNLLQVPGSVDYTALSLLYQAKHDELVYDDDDVEIFLPDALQPALVSFIASEIFSHMNGIENTAKGKEHLSKFDALCKEAVDNDLVSTAISNTNTNFEKRGWI
jgi:hypothetical protein